MHLRVKTKYFREKILFRMAESAYVSLQLQSVALLRGGFKRFVRARGDGDEIEAEGGHEITTISGDAVKQIYEEIIAAPSLSSSREKRNARTEEIVKTEEVIALSDSDDDDLEMVDTSANKELLVAVQQVGLVNLRLI